MIELNPHETCPFGSFCGYSIECIMDHKRQFCRGLDPTRNNVFVCELWAENYEKGALENARNDREFPSCADRPKKEKE